MVALVVHFGLYTTGHLYFPSYMGVTVKNPGVSTALGIVAATGVGGVMWLGLRGRERDLSGPRVGARRE